MHPVVSGRTKGELGGRAGILSDVGGGLVDVSELDLRHPPSSRSGDWACAAGLTGVGMKERTSRVSAGGASSRAKVYGLADIEGPPVELAVVTGVGAEQRLGLARRQRYRRSCIRAAPAPGAGRGRGRQAVEVDIPGEEVGPAAFTADRRGGHRAHAVDLPVDNRRSPTATSSVRALAKVAGGEQEGASRLVIAVAVDVGLDQRERGDEAGLDRDQVRAGVPIMRRSAWLTCRWVTRSGGASRSTVASSGVAGSWRRRCHCGGDSGGCGGGR